MTEAVKGLKDGVAKVPGHQGSRSSAGHITPEPNSVMVDLFNMEAVRNAQDIGRILDSSHGGEIHGRQ